jgi:hypothetical protein
VNRPSVGKAAFVIDNGRGFDIRGGQVGKGPLVELWLSERTVKSTGGIFSMGDIADLIEGLNDLMDKMELDFPPEPE